MSEINKIKVKREWTELEYVIMGDIFSMPERAEKAAVELAAIRADIRLLVASIAAKDAELAEANQAMAAITKGDGPFSRDQLIHAFNCIENMKGIAAAYLAAHPAPAAEG